MLTRTAEEAHLADYERLFQAAQDRQEKAARDAASLRQIIEGIRYRLGQSSADDGMHAAPTRTSNGVANLTSTIRTIMADGKPRNAAALHEALAQRDALPTGDRQRQMRKIAKRLRELLNSGYLERVEIGVYRLRSEESAQK